MNEAKGDIVIYRTDDGQASLRVTLKDQTVWLTQSHMAKLFGKTKQNISLHIGNVFKERELQRDSVVKEYLTTAADGKVYKTMYYNLDVIISVGYRVKSKRGTQFRLWATRVLRDHLVKGYTLNESQLRENKLRLKELEAAIELVERAKTSKSLSPTETAGLLTVITEYTRSWLLLHQYDAGELSVKKLGRDVLFRIIDEEAKKAIGQLRKNLKQREEASDLFGRERERGVLKGILAAIEQTFGGIELYPSIEEKAASLLYFLIKDHPFVDSNKRIASLLFIWFLEKNRYLSTLEGTRKLNDNALVALTLLVAASDPKLKDVMVKLVINLISGR